jgi:hypothetical protein
MNPAAEAIVAGCTLTRVNWRFVMRRVTLLLVPGLLAVAVASALLLRPAAARGGHTASAVVPQGLSCVIDVWSVVPSTNPGANTDILYSVAAVSTGDVWAVGYSEATGNSNYQTLIEHYNGWSWNVSASPNVASTFNTLTAVAGDSPSDAWAVGYTGNPRVPFPVFQTLIEHWNGSTWNITTAPTIPSSTSSQLLGVAAISSTDAWAVGNYFDASSNENTLIEHWNGTSWSVASSPNFVTPVPEGGPGGSVAYLTGITAVAANNIWAVGNPSSLVEHWNGSTWSIVPGPTFSTGTQVLEGVAASSAQNIMAGGTQSSSTTSTLLAEQWNGTGWNVPPTPSLAQSDAFYGVAAIPGTDHYWAVGASNLGAGVQGAASSLQLTAAIEYWDGATWRVMASANPSATWNGLQGVAALGANDAWAVGSYSSSNGPYQTLIEHYHPLRLGRPCV